MTRKRCRLLGVVLAVVVHAACAGNGPEDMVELQRLKSGTLDIVFLSPREGLRHGKDAFVIEFRSPSGQLVDVGAVQASANMPMAGMPMLGTVDVRRTDVPGRYTADGEFSMAGTWRLTVQWDGSGGQESVTFPTSIQ